jgi:hypothetical protein
MNLDAIKTNYPLVTFDEAVARNGGRRYGHKVFIRDDEPASLANRAVEYAKRDLAGQIAMEMGDQPYSVRYDLLAPPRIDDFGFARMYILQAWVTPTVVSEVKFTQPVPAIWQPAPHKTYCEYCSGTTYDDQYGHCIACGGPRGRH